MPGKTFCHIHTVYFNETNAMGGVVYYSNYTKWQGMVREDYFIATVPEWKAIMIEVAKGNVNMITKEEHSTYIRHSYFGDVIRIELQTSDIKTYSFTMVFKMYKDETDELICESWQKLAFDDFKGNFIPIPEPMLKSILEYAIPSEYEKYKKRYIEKKY